jgi:hypothetical protein
MNMINNKTDFWVDANEFMKTQLPDDYQAKLELFIKEKKYNTNEMRLFTYMLKEVLGLHNVVVVIKNA